MDLFVEVYFQFGGDHQRRDHYVLFVFVRHTVVLNNGWMDGQMGRDREGKEL